MNRLHRLSTLFLLLILVGSPGFGAISGSTVWEVRASGASDNNGGGFVAGSGGTDFSVQNAAQVAVGGGVVTSSITTTVVTFTGGTYTVLAGDIGNIVQFISGTNVTAGFYQITAVSAGLNGTWTLDRTPLTSGTTTNAVANMGGALLTLSKLSGAMIASNKAYATGAFTSTATTTFAQSVTTSSSAAPPTRLIGYSAARGDAGMATLTLSTNTSLTGLTATGTGFRFEQMSVDCGSLGTSTGIVVGTSGMALRCRVANFTTSGINVGSSAMVSDCEVTGGVAGANQAILGTATTETIKRCFVHDNACLGVNMPSGVLIECLIVNNSGGSSDGVAISGITTVLNNTIHNNGRDGIRGTTTQLPTGIRNNILTNNGGYGLNLDSAAALPAAPQYDGNAYGGGASANTLGARNNADNVTGIYSVAPYTNVLDVVLSGSPYVGPTTGTASNFALNNTAGAGAACRGVGSPGTWQGNTGTTGFLDMGAVQTRGSNTSPSPGGSPGIITAQ